MISRSFFGGWWGEKNWNSLETKWRTPCLQPSWICSVLRPIWTLRLTIIIRLPSHTISVPWKTRTTLLTPRKLAKELFSIKTMMNLFLSSGTAPVVCKHDEKVVLRFCTSDDKSKQKQRNSHWGPAVTSLFLVSACHARATSAVAFKHAPPPPTLTNEWRPVGWGNNRCVWKAVKNEVCGGGGGATGSPRQGMSQVQHEKKKPPKKHGSKCRGTSKRPQCPKRARQWAATFRKTFAKIVFISKVLLRRHVVQTWRVQMTRTSLSVRVWQLAACCLFKDRKCSWNFVAVDFGLVRWRPARLSVLKQSCSNVVVFFFTVSQSECSRCVRESFIMSDPQMAWDTSLILSLPVFVTHISNPIYPMCLWIRFGVFERVHVLQVVCEK